MIDSDEKWSRYHFFAITTSFMAENNENECLLFMAFGSNGRNSDITTNLVFTLIIIYNGDCSNISWYNEAVTLMALSYVWMVDWSLRGSNCGILIYRVCVTIVDIYLFNCSTILKLVNLVLRLAVDHNGPLRQLFIRTLINTI